MRYLKSGNKRKNAVIEGWPANTDRFRFKHQDVSQIPKFRKHGVSGDIFQMSRRARHVVRKLGPLIEDSAEEFGVDPDLVKAAIYTEAARGGFYGRPAEAAAKAFPFLPEKLKAQTILPGNLGPEWEALIPGSDRKELQDNIRLSAKLVSEIAKRLDSPKPEDAYALYNGRNLDRAYQNAELKDTPCFFKRAYDEKAWEYETWGLDVDAKDIEARAKGWLGSGPAPQDWQAEPPNRRTGRGVGSRWLRPAGPPDQPALSDVSRSRAEKRKAAIERYMREDRESYFKNERACSRSIAT